VLAAQSSPVSGFVFVVAVLATSIVLVAALAWASRQLLGLPVGTLRAFIAGSLGFVVAYLLGRSLQAAQPGHAVAFFTVVTGLTSRGRNAPRNMQRQFFTLVATTVINRRLHGSCIAYGLQPISVARYLDPAIASLDVRGICLYPYATLGGGG
jgi:hypothetical protein